MAEQQIHIVREYNKPVEEVFAALADHNNLGKVLGAPVKRIKDAAKGDVNGVGSVRRIGMGPLVIEETVTAVTTNKSIRYKITKGGAPIRNHSGELKFAKTAQGSQVQWDIQFDSSLPIVGTLVRLVLKQAISMGLKRV